MLFDGISREYRDNLLGDVVTVRKRVKLDEITEEFLREGWTNDTIEEEKGIVQISISKDTNKTGSTWNAWTEYQVTSSLATLNNSLLVVLRPGDSKRLMGLGVMLGMST